MKWFAFTLAFALAIPAAAHDLWLEKDTGEFSLYYGHKYSDHRGADLLEYDPAWVREAWCFDETGARTTLQAQRTYPYRIRAECAAAYVLTSSGYWTKTPYGTKNVPRTEARMPIKSWLSYESVKRIDHWNAAMAKPLTAGLEMTPLNDPLRLRKSRKLRLRVTFEGRPVEGVVVTYDGKPRGQTGEEGEINIRVRHGGFQVVQASLERPDASEKVDQVIHSGNLNFELPEE